MSTKECREYYERLAQAREELRKELAQKTKEMSFWSINYRASFKEILYAMVSKRMDFAHCPTVLDVGCGRGLDLAALSRRYRFNAYGIDFSFTRLKLAADDTSPSRFMFIQADAQHIPFKDSTLDMVICSELVEHLPKAEPCLEGIHRVLKKGGFLFLTTPNRWDYFHFIGQIIPKTLRKGMAKFLRGYRGRCRFLRLCY